MTKRFLFFPLALLVLLGCDNRRRVALWHGAEMRSVDFRVQLENLRKADPVVDAERAMDVGNFRFIRIEAHNGYNMPISHRIDRRIEAAIYHRCGFSYFALLSQDTFSNIPESEAREFVKLREDYALRYNDRLLGDLTNGVYLILKPRSR